MARPVEAATNSRFVLLASSAIIIAGLYLGREVLIPIALAVLLSFMLGPPVSWLERLHLPRIAATLIVVLIGMGLIGGLGYVVGQQVDSIIDSFPSYEAQLQAKLRSIGHPGGVIQKIEKEAETVTSPDVHPVNPSGAPIGDGSSPSAHPPVLGTPDQPMAVRVFPPPSTAWGLIREYSDKVLGPLATAVIVLVFVIFMLLSREDLRDRVIRLLGHGRLNLTTQALDEAATRISSYLGALGIVNACYALITALGLFVIAKAFGQGHRFPNVLVWAILVGLLRFVPYVGIFIGAGIPLILAFALFPTNGVFFGVLIMFAVLEIVVAQFIEPMWYGSTTGMSALAVLVAAVFWTWLWGPVGLLLSTPLTVILVVMGKYVPQLKFLDILLREEPVLAPPFRFYQRLIALDQEDAADLASEYLKEKQSLQAVYEDLFVPALSMAEQDSHHERVADEQLIFVRQSVRDFVDELAEQWRTLADKTPVETPVETTPLATASNRGAVPAPVIQRNPRLPDGCSVTVLCLPARDQADEILALMLGQLLESRGYRVLAPTADALAAEMTEMVESKHVDVVCISAMPPAAVAHARYLCKRLQSRFPDLGLIVGLWTMKGDLNRAKERLGCSSSARLSATLEDAQRQLDELVQPIILRAASRPAETPPAAAVGLGH